MPTAASTTPCAERSCGSAEHGQTAKTMKTTSGTITYDIHDIAAYINWLYFFHAWGFQPKYAAVANVHQCVSCLSTWRSRFTIEEQPKALEAMKLLKDANKLLAGMDLKVKARCTFRLLDACSDGDNILMGGTVFPLLRQQVPGSDGHTLCLSDFVKPLSPDGRPDTVGVFAATVDETAATALGGGCGKEEDPYHKLLAQTLADRLVEAAVEKMHLYVRQKAWGYAPFEDLSIPDMLQERFQGIRPAVGYPSLPDQSVNFLIDRLIDMKQIGITLTENGAMSPHASVSGLMLAHPQARYFSIGKIGEDQLADYAARRGLPIAEMRRFLAANL